jgi:nitroreductase
MDAIEALKTRRAIRAYTAKPVSREMIEQIVDCGRLAATAKNLQPWEFVVVTERRMLQRLAEVADYGKHIASAAACILVFCGRSNWYLEDGAAATENMLLAAHAYGLGACWVDGDKKPYAETVRREAGAPEGYKLISMIPLGYPAESPQQPKRPLSEVLHWERF